MLRPSSTISRLALCASLGLLVAGLSGCGLANPVAPVDPSQQTGASAMVARVTKNPNHANGRQNNTLSAAGKSSPTPSGAMSGGTTSGNFHNPGDGEQNEPLVIE